jgi:erythromycin esterase
VVVAHNNHVQKTPVVFGGELAAYPLGYYLHRVLGADYRAVALTHTADPVPEMNLGGGVLGFTLVDTAVAPPSPGSVERFLLDLGLGDQVTLTSLRPAAGGGGQENSFGRIRAQSEEQELAVADAFDGVVSVPSTTESFEAHLWQRAPVTAGGCRRPGCPSRIFERCRVRAEPVVTEGER